MKRATLHDHATSWLRHLLHGVLLAVVLLFTSVRPAAAQTPVPGGTLGDTTWTAAGSPYIVSGGLTVAAGATLTVEPGVTVQFDGYWLTVDGTLTAVGTAAAPIVIKGLSDTPGYWDGITIEGDSGNINTGSRLAYVTLSDGKPNLTLFYAHVTVANSVISNSSSEGIYGQQAGVADVSATSFTGNQGYALSFDDGSVDPALASITMSGNGTNAIRLGGGTIAASRTWKNVGVPYQIEGGFTVAAGATLTVEPGVTVQFDGYWLTVDGTLMAVGTAAAPIVFKGLSDTPGYWDGIAIEGDSGNINTGSRLEYVTLSDGKPNLDLYFAHVTVANSVISNSSSDGIHGELAGVADVSATSFTGNQGYGLSFDDGSVDPALASITMSGNGTNAIRFAGGTIAASRTWKNLGLPYRITGGLVVATGATLTVEPGVTVQFDGYWLTVDGTLIAVGTAAAPIVFKGLSDTPGYWDGITIEGDSGNINTGSRLEYVTLSDGKPNLDLYFAHVTVANSVISNSSSEGIHGELGGIADVSATSFAGNQGYGLSFDDGSVDPALAAITMSGSGTNAIRLGGGTIGASRTWKNVGVPYQIEGALTVAAGATLTVEAGVTVQFDGYWLTVDGTLIAVGTAAAPIVFKGLSDTPGYWDGITIEGDASNTNIGSRLEYVTLSDGGPNLSLYYAKAHLSNCQIQHSSADGIDGTYAGGTVIEWSSFTDISGAGYAVLNSTADPNEPIWAVNNWWGSSTGPTTGDLCNPNGGGDRVSSGVTYLPFLTQSGTDTGPVAPLDLFNLTLAPVRWYVPADGSSQAWVKIGLRDRLGQPVQGKNVTLGSSLGTVTGGAPTDINGEAFAYVVSDTPGTAALTAGLAAGDACQPYRPATSTITFTASDSNPLMPDSAAPYLSSDIEISPMPIVKGVSTTVRAHVKNPNSFPISVNADFSFAQLGIGLAFGPIGSVTGQTIAANAEGVLQITWVPAISGHYCIQLHYNGARVPQSSALSSGSGDFSGEAQENLDAQPGCMRSSGEENTIDKAEKVMDWAHIGTVGLNGAEMGETLASEGVLGGPSPFLIPEIGAGFLTHWILEKGREIGNALAGVGDCTPGNSSSGGSSSGSGGQGSSGSAPPGGFPGSSSGGYTQISKPVHYDFPPLPAGNGTSQARADAYNNWTRAALDAFSDFAAMETAEQASSDAAGAGDLDWQAQQNAAYILYQTQTGNALIALADATDSLLSVARSEGVIYDVITVADAQTYLGLLQTKGFSDADKQAAKLLGFTDAQIEWFRQQILALRPEDLAGDRVALWAAMSAAWREMGQALLAPPPIMAPTALPSALVTSQGNLARIYGRTSSFVLGNPLAAQATINLQVRKVDLPPDWTVKLTPSSVTLDPGKQTTVSVDIQPGSSLAQGSKPRLAVEAYAQDQLLGGVVLDTLVPKYASITSSCSGTGNIAQGATCACSMDCQSGLICGSTGTGARQCLVPCNLTATASICPSGQTCSKWSGSGGLCTTGGGTAPDGGTASPSKTSSGCSCRVANSESETSMLLFAFIGLGFFFSRRRSDGRGRSKT